MEYYVQTTSYFAGDQWHTVAILDDKDLAEKLASELVITERETPNGLKGAQKSRCISSRDIAKQEGARCLVDYTDDYFSSDFDRLYIDRILAVLQALDEETPEN